MLIILFVSWCVLYVRLGLEHCSHKKYERATSQGACKCSCVLVYLHNQTRTLVTGLGMELAILIKKESINNPSKEPLTQDANLLRVVWG